jgi:hypothetical protein
MVPIDIPRNETCFVKEQKKGQLQRIYKTKKPRQQTRWPKTGPWAEFNPAILLNIWSAIIPPSFSFDTMDPSLSWEVHFVDSYMDTDMEMDMDMDTDMDTDMKSTI